MTPPKKKREEAAETPPSSPEHSSQRRVRGEEADTAIQLIHLRFLTKNVRNQEALAQQRGEYGPDLARRTFDLGNRVIAALGPADKNGQRGIFESGHLAEELIGTVNELIEFVIAEGHVPTRIQLLNEQVTDLRSIIQEEIRTALKEQLARAAQQSTHSVPDAP